MTTFDVRANKDEEVSKIVFADVNDLRNVAMYVAKEGREGIEIVDEGGEFVIIDDAEHADNLIKALEKAKELGWLK